MKNIPQLRFAGFDGEWEESRLQKLGNAISGNISIDKSDSGSYLLPVYKVSDMNLVGNNVFMNQSQTYVDLGTIRKNRMKVINQIPSIIFAKRGAAIALERKRIVTHPFLLDTNMMAYSPNINNEVYFLKQYLDFKGFYMFIQSGALPAINIKDINSYKIKTPNYSEQERIGDLFKKIDALIEKQEDKVSKMEDFKKSMLQKMFPKKGELVPDFRFDGFDGEWEDLSIGDKYEVTMGQSPKSENYTNDTKFMVLVQGNADLENGRVTPRIYTKEVTKISKKGDILMTVRAPVGTLAINEYDVVIGRGVCTIKGNTFLYYSLTNMNLNNYWNRFSSGSTFESINSSDIKNAGLKKPSISEQQKIGQFFKNLDTKIETEKKLLDSYKMMKKSLLQKMFV